jgi:hypothetical protein
MEIICAVFGFRLLDNLVVHNIPYLVTPPSLVPQEYGNSVKTDRRDTVLWVCSALTPRQLDKFGNGEWLTHSR